MNKYVLPFWLFLYAVYGSVAQFYMLYNIKKHRFCIKKKVNALFILYNCCTFHIN